MYAVLLTALPVAIGAPALKDPPAAEASLVGEWVVESTTFAGKTRPFAGDPLRYVFTADGKWLTYRGDGPEGENGGYVIDATARPWRIDLRADTTRPELPTTRAIYKVEGDTFTLCFALEPGSHRPTAFEAPRGSDAMLYVLKRVKKE